MGTIFLGLRKVLLSFITNAEKKNKQTTHEYRRDISFTLGLSQPVQAPVRCLSPKTPNDENGTFLSNINFESQITQIHLNMFYRNNHIQSGVWIYSGLRWWLSGKELPANAGDEGSIPGWGRFPGEGNDNSLQYSCLGNPTDRGAWWATVHGVRKQFSA